MDKKLFEKKLSEVCEWEAIPHLAILPKDPSRPKRPRASKYAKTLLEEGAETVPVILGYNNNICDRGVKNNNGEVRTCKKFVAFTQWGTHRYRVDYCTACRTIFLPDGSEKYWVKSFTHNREVYEMIKNAKKKP